MTKGGVRFSARAAVLLALAASCPSDATLAGNAGPSDWPCPQVLVRRISLPAVWSGPSIDGVSWRGDPARLAHIAKLAARRTPIEEAQKSIEDLAASAGPRKDKELLTLFAGLFETLDTERTQVIDGLVRFGRKQRELAETIKAEQAAIRGTAPDAESAVARLEWNLRVFEERRQALASVCESPALIEQRLFALARAIQQNLE
jgi:hypothetical protein